MSDATTILPTLVPNPDGARAPQPPRRSAPLRWAIQIAIYLAVAAGVAAFALSILSHDRPEPVQVPPPVAVTGTAVAVPAGAPAWEYIKLGVAHTETALPPLPVAGQVTFDETRTTRLTSPLVGRVDAVLTRIGTPVEEGEKILSIRSGALVDLMVAVKLAETELSAQRRAVERVKSLVDLNAAPAKDLVSAQKELRETELSLEAARMKQRSLHVASAQDGLFWLLAPKSGIVVSRNVAVGQEVGPDTAEPLVVISQLDEVRVHGSVPETDVGGVLVGSEATIASPAAPGRKYIGEVEYVSEQVDPIRRTVDVRVRMKNADHSLRPNAYVQVTFSTQTDARIVVPAEAVVTDDQSSVVFVQEGTPPRLVQRTVELGRQRNGKVEVISGLKAGESLVIKGALLLLNAVSLGE